MFLHVTKCLQTYATSKGVLHFLLLGAGVSTISNQLKWLKGLLPPVTRSDGIAKESNR